jgi:hypothetical protein
VEIRARRKDELRSPIEGLLRQARERQRAAALANWIRLGGEVTTEARERAWEVTGEYPEDYTVEEAEHLLKKFKGWTRQLEHLLADGAASGFSGLPRYENRRLELLEVQRSIRLAVNWLEGVERRLIAWRREKKRRESTSARIFSVHVQPAEA